MVAIGCNESECWCGRLQCVLLTIPSLSSGLDSGNDLELSGNGGDLVHHLENGLHMRHT